MPFVDKPDRWSSDAIIPGRTVDPDGWVTEHTVIEGLHGPITLYFSVGGLRLLADRYPQVGLVSKAELTSRDHALAEALTAVQQLKLERDELKAKLERISGLQRDGFKVARVQGRPPTKTKAGA